MQKNADIISNSIFIAGIIGFTVVLLIEFVKMYKQYRLERSIINDPRLMKQIRLGNKILSMSKAEILKHTILWKPRRREK